jgi:formate-dependent nitrite reductase cytochrome c552 subunit
MSLQRTVFVSITMLVGLGLGAAALAQTGADVTNSRHNLSVSGPGPVTTADENQVCVFCHTPHGATISPGAPLWNRQLSTQTYTTYTSSSLDAETIAGQLQQPAGSSKLCLSCHDGSMAIGAVNVSGGQQNVTFNMAGTGAGGEMPAGDGTQTGYTRNLGVDLTNDHPISLTFDTTLAIADGELRDPATSDEIGLRSPGVRPLFPLEPTGPANEAQLQCASCHDPHLPDTGGEPRKFLRGNRLQLNDPVGAFDAANDIVCLGCHDKEGWVGSVHASSVTADETYTAGAAAQREFPANTPVWQASCLNCHDSHTVHGARRLLRDGTDSGAVPKSGGNSAVEETCYQCHSATPVVTNTAGDVKNIASDFALANHMPINNFDQRAATEAHDILDADLNETRTSLGRTEPLNRHAECTDCHNPHRAMKNALFNGTGAPTSAHNHASGHTNLASGALAGTSGVEPIYADPAFLALPTSYEVKSGVGTGTDVTAPQVTREYQVCLKCHSDYGYDDNGVYPIGTRPNLGDSGGGTLAGTNNMEQYTNQAMEFQAPLVDQGAPGANHRSWHPVMAPTGRTLGLRNMGTGAFLAPWTNDVGTQTMYCSDCHGTNTAQNSVVPTGDRPWGPHGSENDFILKGPWNTGTGGTPNPVDTLCFRCHDAGDYSGTSRGAGTSGFSDGQDNLHTLHSERLERIRCNWCHVAVPHGWKNKALLVNLNDVGEEAGLSPVGTEVPINSAGQTYNIGPYYMNAKLKIRSFATSGNWQEANCGSANNQQGPDDSVGRDWMRAVCEVPP